MNQLKKINLIAVTVIVCIVLISLGLIWIVNITKSNQQLVKRDAVYHQVKDSWPILRSIADNIPPLL